MVEILLRHMSQCLFLIIIMRIIIYYDYYFYLKAVRQRKDCYFISLMLEMLSPCYWLVHFTKLM